MFAPLTQEGPRHMCLFFFLPKNNFPSLLTVVRPVCMKLILPGPWHTGVHITETFPDGAYVDSSLERPRTQQG